MRWYDSGVGLVSEEEPNREPHGHCVPLFIGTVPTISDDVEIEPRCWISSDSRDSWRGRVLCEIAVSGGHQKPHFCRIDG